MCSKLSWVYGSLAYLYGSIIVPLTGLTLSPTRSNMSRHLYKCLNIFLTTLVLCSSVIGPRVCVHNHLLIVNTLLLLSDHILVYEYTVQYNTNTTSTVCYIYTCITSQSSLMLRTRTRTCTELPLYCSWISTSTYVQGQSKALSTKNVCIFLPIFYSESRIHAVSLHNSRHFMKSSHNFFCISSLFMN